MMFSLSFMRRKVNPDAAKEAILALPEPRRTSVISELVKAVSGGALHLHRNPYTVNPRVKV